jgi:hypothetical protein
MGCKAVGQGGLADWLRMPPPPLNIELAPKTTDNWRTRAWEKISGSLPFTSDALEDDHFKRDERELTVRSSVGRRLCRTQTLPDVSPPRGGMLLQWA